MAPARFIDALSCRLRSCFSRSDIPRDERHRLGLEGERRAARYLRKQNFRVLYRNFRAPHGGEVDIVCRDKGCAMLVFAEVKTRRRSEISSPAAAVDAAKQRLISRGALEWMRLLGNPEICFRFDIVEVVIDDGLPEFNLIKDAFKLSDPYIY